MANEQDIVYMRRAMELAARGHGFVHPNPYVGAVIVKEGRVIGEGWHERCGSLHAERNAFAHLTESAEGATLYVTLEPCCHYGKTPPCTEAVIENGIARVVAGILDPNPKVAGKGLAILREAGIEVECGGLEEELREQNRIFLKYITTGMPWVAFKSAMTLDGKIAAESGDSRWVSCEESRAMSHALRGELAAIAVGVGTVLADDPMLDCRLPGSEGEVHQPLRIVVDSRASIPLESKLVATARKFRTLVAHTPAAPAGKIAALQEVGVETLECLETLEAPGIPETSGMPGTLGCNAKNAPQAGEAALNSQAGCADAALNSQAGRVDIVDMLQRLGTMGIDSLILEGGGTLASAFVRSGMVDEVFCFIAPKIIGGSAAKTPVEGHGIQKMADAVRIGNLSCERVGCDLLVRGRVDP